MNYLRKVAAPLQPLTKEQAQAKLKQDRAGTNTFWNTLKALPGQLWGGAKQLGSSVANTAKSWANTASDKNFWGALGDSFTSWNGDPSLPNSGWKSHLKNMGNTGANIIVNGIPQAAKTTWNGTLDTIGNIGGLVTGTFGGQYRPWQWTQKAKWEKPLGTQFIEGADPLSTKIGVGAGGLMASIAGAKGLSFAKKNLGKVWQSKQKLAPVSDQFVHNVQRNMQGQTARAGQTYRYENGSFARKPIKVDTTRPDLRGSAYVENGTIRINKTPRLSTVFHQVGHVMDPKLDSAKYAAQWNDPVKLLGKGRGRGLLPTYNHTYMSQLRATARGLRTAKQMGISEKQLNEMRTSLGRALYTYKYSRGYPGVFITQSRKAYNAGKGVSAANRLGYAGSASNTAAKATNAAVQQAAKTHASTGATAVKQVSKGPGMKPITTRPNKAVPRMTTATQPTSSITSPASRIRNRNMSFLPMLLLSGMFRGQQQPVQQSNLPSWYGQQTMQYTPANNGVYRPGAYGDTFNQMMTQMNKNFLNRNSRGVV